jgi:CHAT domain-containing protein
MSDKYRYNQPARGRVRSRLHICATGVFSQLPLHAAGAYRTRGPESCSEYCVASYTPTLSIMLRLGRDFKPPRRSQAKFLLAAAPNPVGWSPLSYANTEVAILNSLVPQQCILGGSARENSEQATGVATYYMGLRNEIIENLPNASFMHLACHGLQDEQSPLSSGFAMQDGMLALSELMQLDLSNAFLAFLSACDTARGNIKQPDQSIHLAAAMLFAGFRSVIGTMW